MNNLFIRRFGFKSLLMIFMSSFMNYSSFSQLSITSTGTNYTIDFESTATGINNGLFAGTGLEPTPVVGRLDSDGWASTGLSDGNSTYGDTKTTGDFARGTSTGGVTTGGFYSFQVAAGDYGLGIQPSTADLTPGTIILRIHNNSGLILESVNLSYNICEFNDQEVATTLNFSYSTDNVTFTQISALDYTSPAAATGAVWNTFARSTTITGLNIYDGSYIYFRWNSDDAGGSGSRDEIAIDDIVISASTGDGVSNPSNFNAQTVSTSQINLSWLQNANLDDVMIAANTTNSFGTPSGTYSVNDLIGTAIVIYIGPLTLYSHTGLPVATEQFYKAWSVDVSGNYSAGVVDSSTTQFLEPSGHPTGLTATSNGPVYITVSWTDSDAAHYLINGSTVGYETIVPPVDGVGQGDSFLVKNVDASILSHQFNGLTPNTQYYFKIWPYNGGGESSNYKTDGTVPESSATTDELDIDLIISEVADPIQNNMRFVELYNTGTATIDFANDIVYFCRQSNGVPDSWASVQLTGTLPAGETYIIAYQATYFDTAYSQLAETYSSLTVNNNGNDGVFLYYGGNQTIGYMFDAYGSINVDGESEPWNYTDGHAVRKRTVTSPNTTWSAAEWAVVRNINYKNMTPDMHAADVTWQGTTSTGWNTRGNNWSGLYGWVPDASCIVTIPNVTNYPVVTEPSASHQVIIQSNSTLSVSGTGKLLIVGP